MRLLLAEDDATLGRATCIYLMREGHAVDWVTTGNQVLELMGTFTYECVMLDLGLPELGGQDCLVNLRARDDSTPVIVTTARSQRHDRIQMLDQGADDYLVKPYDLGELAARVKAIVRRSQLASSDTAEHRLADGLLTPIPSSNAVMWRGQRVELAAKEFRVLEVLLQRSHRVVTRQQLEAEVYGWNEEVGSNAIEVHVYHLRRKLAAGVIRTVRGVGYQLDVL